MQSLEKAVDYKFYWGKELERRKSAGTTGPEPIPHPDDVHINVRTSEITIAGPWTKEEKAELDRWYDRVEALDRNIELRSSQLKKSDPRWCVLMSKAKSLMIERFARQLSARSVNQANEEEVELIQYSVSSDTGA
jgi:hypothetical protein